jgi:hypothetical protein
MSVALEKKTKKHAKYNLKNITPWAPGLLCHPALGLFLLRISTEQWEINSNSCHNS